MQPDDQTDVPAPASEPPPDPRPKIPVQPSDGEVYEGVGAYCFREPDALPSSCGCESIFVGSHRHACNPHLLRRMGITHVLNCAGSECVVPSKEYAARGIAYAQIDALDHEGYPLIEQHLSKSLSFLHPCLMAGGGGKALVHGVHGRNRSAALAVATVMFTMRIPLLVVLRRLFHCRPIILSNKSFRLQLRHLAQLRGQLVAPQGLLRGAIHWAATHAHGIVCEHCGQAHVALPEARMDFSLRCSCSKLTVYGLLGTLQQHLGQPLTIEVEQTFVRPTVLYELPLVPFATLTLAQLPAPITGIGFPFSVPTALLHVQDGVKGVRYTVGLHDTDSANERGSSGSPAAGSRGAAPTVAPVAGSQSRVAEACPEVDFRIENAHTR